MEEAPPVVLVDARNVLRSRWPNLAEGELVERARAWGERERVRVVLVFDGAAPGELVGARELDGCVTAVGSGRESADDWIAREARRLEHDGERVWLVTSDRELRARVGGSAERMLGGGGFVGQL